jgi:hypothetical protein
MHLSLPLRLSPPKVTLVKMLTRKNIMLTIRSCFKPMPLKFKLYKNELESLRAQLANLKGKSSQPASHAQPVRGSKSHKGPPRSFYGLSHNALVGEYVLFSAHNFSLTLKIAIFFSLFTSQHKTLVWHPKFLPLSREFRLMDSHLVQVLLPRLKKL